MSSEWCWTGSWFKGFWSGSLACYEWFQSEYWPCQSIFKEIEKPPRVAPIMQNTQDLAELFAYRISSNPTRLSTLEISLYCLENFPHWTLKCPKLYTIALCCPIWITVVSYGEILINRDLPIYSCFKKELEELCIMCSIETTQMNYFWNQNH